MKKIFFSALLLGAMFTSCSDDDDFSYETLTDSPIEEAKLTESFYLVNEGWFGKDNGSVHSFKKNGNAYDIKYRVFAAANGGASLGATTCYSTVWGDNIYFVSKQGDRLIVADAKTLKKKAAIAEVGGDGVSFLGINDKKAYVATTQGIVLFDLESNSLGKTVQGIDVQIGNMAYANGKVFAVSPNAIFVIDANTDAVVKKIEGEFTQLTMDRKGNMIVSSKGQFVLLNSETLAQETIAYPDGEDISNLWGMWNPGNLTTSMKTDHLYWIAANGWSGGRKVYKTDLNAKTTKLLFTLGKSKDNVDLEFYGAGLRVDPLTDELIGTVTLSGWGENKTFNWLYKFNSEGKEIMHQDILNQEGKNYYWFPELPVFEDLNKPQIILNQVVLKEALKAEINLADKVIDHDNIFPTMSFAVETETPNIAKVSLNGSTLVVEPGTEEGYGTFTLSVVSNGVKVNKTIQVVNDL